MFVGTELRSRRTSTCATQALTRIARLNCRFRRQKESRHYRAVLNGRSQKFCRKRWRISSQFESFPICLQSFERQHCQTNGVGLSKCAIKNISPIVFIWRNQAKKSRPEK